MATGKRRTSKTAKRAGKRSNPRRARATRYWSGEVTRNSDALDLEASVFTLRDPNKIAASLKRSAERSRRRKSSPYRSAMSMLTFYINRAGKNLSAAQLRRLNAAKQALRAQFGKES